MRARSDFKEENEGQILYDISDSSMTHHRFQELDRGLSKLVERLLPQLQRLKGRSFFNEVKEEAERILEQESPEEVVVQYEGGGNFRYFPDSSALDVARDVSRLAMNKYDMTLDGAFAEGIREGYRGAVGEELDLK